MKAVPIGRRTTPRDLQREQDARIAYLRERFNARSAAASNADAKAGRAAPRDSADASAAGSAEWAS